MKMEKNLVSQTIRPLLPPIRVFLRLRTHPRTTNARFGKKWYWGTNLQATGFLVFFLFFCVTIDQNILIGLKNNHFMTLAI